MSEARDRPRLPAWWRGQATMFDWDAENERHIVRLTRAEVEHVLTDPMTRDIDMEVVDGGGRVTVSGATNDGRLFVVVYSERNGRIHPVTAFRAPARYRRYYE